MSVPCLPEFPSNDQGAQVLLAQLLEAAQEESRVGATQQLGQRWTNGLMVDACSHFENISKIGNIGKYGRDMNVVTFIELLLFRIKSGSICPSCCIFCSCLVEFTGKQGVTFQWKMFALFSPCIIHACMKTRKTLVVKSYL